MRDRRLGTLALLHALGLLMAAVTYLSWDRFLGSAPSLFVLSIIWGSMAAAAGWIIGLGSAFFLLNLAAPVLCGVILTWAAPGWLFPVLLLAAAGFHWNAAIEGVPLYLSNRTTRAALSDLAGERGAKRVIDLGCGVGGVVSHIARVHPEAQVTGVETAPFCVLIAKLRMAAQSNALVSAMSLWRVDLGQYDLVYCFLSPVPMTRLFEKAQAEMRTDSLFVSNSFGVPGQPADEIRELADRRRTKLYLWRMTGGTHIGA